MDFGSEMKKFITKEEIFARSLRVVVLSFEEREVRSKDKTKIYTQILAETDKGWIIGWDCYPCKIEIGDKLNLTCADIKDKITITKIL